MGTVRSVKPALLGSQPTHMLQNRQTCDASHDTSHSKPIFHHLEDRD